MKFGDVEHNSVFDHSIYIYIYLIVLKEVTDMGCVAVSISLLGRKRLRGRGCSHARSKRHCSALHAQPVTSWLDCGERSQDERFCRMCNGRQHTAFTQTPVALFSGFTLLSMEH